MVPDTNPTKTFLRATVHLAAYATAYRYPGTARIPQSPSVAAIEDHLSNFQRALDAVSVDRELRRLGGEIRESTRDHWLTWSAGQLDTLLPVLKWTLLDERRPICHSTANGV